MGRYITLYSLVCSLSHQHSHKTRQTNDAGWVSAADPVSVEVADLDLGKAEG